MYYFNSNTEQSPSSKANISEDSKKFPAFSESRRFNAYSRGVDDCSPHHHILLNKHYNIILPSKSRSSQWSHSFGLSNQKPEQNILLPHACDIFCPSHLPWFDHSSTRWRSKICKNNTGRSNEYISNTMNFKNLLNHSNLAVSLLSNFKLKNVNELLNLTLLWPTPSSWRILSRVDFAVNYKDENILRRPSEWSKIEVRSSKIWSCFIGALWVYTCSMP